ncbi:MAG: acyltransferase family protein [Lachnospiraceae bacterium]|nr:acyltransferase family protein [Lachnospiraceae bacterium]
MEMIKKERICLFDNLKALLILFVVFGHALEALLKDSHAEFLYMLIYSFHMPLFAFCSGFFAKYDPARIKKNLMYPFFVFQGLYLLFDHFCLKQDAVLTLTKPYWLMWYLFAMIIWEMVLPFVDSDSLPRQLSNLALFTVLGILAGYDKTIGYYMSLSRILVYFPFFLAAYYVRRQKLLEGLLTFAKSRSGRILSLLSVLGMTGYIALHQNQYKVSWLYGSIAYADGEYDALFRLQLYLFAMLWLLFLAAFVPNRRTVLTGIGENSLYIYLLHGFIIKYANHIHVLKYVEYKIPTAFLLSVLLVYLLSRRPVRKLCAPLVRLPRFGSWENAVLK